MQPDGGLVFEPEMRYGKADEYGPRTFEYQFVPYSQMTEGWGRATIPFPLPAPGWLPVLTRSGDIEAQEIGAPKARIKG